MFSLAKHKDWKKGGNGFPALSKVKTTLTMALFQLMCH